ncbi:MAG: protein kinase domain-containing protein [Thermoguttaceae bacterium]|jgi:serine/threonine protein kinase/tetratricopeptide (TPR) repeat protein
MSSPEDERISEACSLEDPQVIRALCEYREALAAGHPLERHGVLSKFPQIQGELRNCLDALDMMHDMAGRIHKSGYRAPGKPVAGTLSDSENLLGDFRLIRMIGRGGMGVVYEAEQLSLQRRVALKILPASVVLDPTNLRRFKIESQAAASLDHPNIVSVYAVGCEEGVHYYAMQYIHGQTLDQIIRRLREESSREGNKEPPGRNGRTGASGKTGSPGAATPQAAGMLEPTTLAPAPGALNDPSARTSTWQTPRREPNPPPVIAISEPAAVAEIPPSAAFPRSARDPGFFRAAARLGIQAADGLQHAHEMGVVHRDIKPGNLILDGRGCLRITDFGLARTAQNADTTLSGGLAGTLRYMSPEQLSGARHVLDHRTDIYSLGITLYELLTLEPAFDSGSREELMRRIAEEEPRSPRRMNRAVPKDLETIVLKSMAKEPAGRYASAKDLADDLRRFLEHKPILARPASFGDRLTRCLQRHSSVVWTTTAALLLGVIGLGVGSGLIWAKGQETARALLLVQARDRELTLSSAREAEARKIAERNATQATEQTKKLQANFRVLFRESTDLSLLCNSLWASGQLKSAERLCRGLVTLWEAMYGSNKGEIRDADALALASAYELLSEVLEALGQLEEAKTMRRQEILVLEEQSHEGPEQLASYFLWEAARAQTGLAALLAGTGQLEEAEKAYRSAIAALDKHPDEPWPESQEATRFYVYSGLERILWAADRLEEAKTAHHQAVMHWRKLAEIEDPGYVARECLAWLLATCPDEELRNPQEAVKLAREAVAMLPARLSECWNEHDRWLYWKTLGVAIYRTGDWQAAADALASSTGLHSWGDRADRLFLAMAQWQLGKHEEARRLHNEAVQWMETHKPKDPELRRFREEAARLILPAESKKNPSSD